MSLLVVLPFFYGDEHLLLKNLEWMKELDGRLDYDCLLACDHLTDPEPARVKASTLFRSISVLRYKAQARRDWPWPQNNAFLNTAWHVYAKHKGPWLWVETDSIPMCKGWLDALWAEYQKGGKPFGGHWNHATNVFNGVAIYPQNISQYSQKIMMSGLVENYDKTGKLHQPPWDAYGSVEVQKHLHVMNGLMQHIWQNDATCEAWTFPDRETVERVIRPGVVLFHRCKNESLVARLREGATPQADIADVVLLCSGGDIISILPLLKRMSEQQFKRPVRLAVLRQYAPILDGVSYVDAVPCDADKNGPLEVAQLLNAANAQVCGRGITNSGSTSNFATQAWLQLGHKWDAGLPLIFDKRNRLREHKLAKSVFLTTKPKVLVKLHGYSSPFRGADELRTSLNEIPDVELVNLDNVKAEKAYDLLGLMDRASCCVTVDTMTIHLAPATKCPMVQLVNDTNFGASPAKGNCLLRIPYKDAIKRLPEIISAVTDCVKVPCDT